MIHSIARVAESRFLDPEIAAEVAKTSKHVIRDGGEPFVSTMTADAFVAEVQAAQGDYAANEAIRQREFAAYRERLRTLSG